MRTLRSRRRERSERAQPEIVPDAMAAAYVGRHVTLEGVVAAVTATRSSPGMHILHLGAVHPAETLTIWIPDTLRLSALHRLRGRRVRVTGAVWLYEGLWPAVTLADASALTA